jgi:hypothetical protein
MSAPTVHDDWLSLIEISGPFLAVPVLKEVFPQGLEGLDGIKKKRLRQGYEEWREALDLEDVQFAELHAAWIEEVLSRGLELDEDGKGGVLKRGDWCAANLKASLHEHGVTLSPHLAVVDAQRSNKALMLIQTYAQDVDLDVTLKQDGWAAKPADRMVALCRSLGCRLGLVTNGERWMLVDAPVGAVSTFASWYARIWTQEPITLQAFVHLLGIRRFFVDESEQLPALFDRSLKFQDEVTDALGEQVSRAVEVLIQTLDKADQDRNRELLHDVKESELYEAALTVMMRLVFLLSAEERGLLLMGDERYEANYALSTLRMQLLKESEEILERRWDAWSRLLAIFRAVFGGIEHENLRLPALGGSLFDPDRFPFLEGRAKSSNWRSDAAKPLPIDNRTVLLLLGAIQQFQGRTLSYRALDVEQIGYVYEGLLERTVKRTDEVTLELDATKSAKTPWVKLAELDSAQLDGAIRLAELLQERSGSSASRVRNDLAKPVDDSLADRLLTACQGDSMLRERVKPYAHLLRTDPWGYPLVYPAGAFIVTTGSDRRETGTHYTPKSLTEAIVAETLTPVAYVGPAEGTPRAHWELKSPAALLELKICDPAMGSGAFLVQACRWLSDRLVEAWSQVEAMGETVSLDGEVLEAGSVKQPLPSDSEARILTARRLIAERCLYGVDLNPLAVELAKLSIWLVTLAKERPFGFLDHNLRCGDSLLGIHRLDQLTELSISPSGKEQLRLFGQNIERAVREAIELRQQIREMPIRDIRDVEAMAHLDADARRKLDVPERIADAFIGKVFASGGNFKDLENSLASLAIQAGQAIDGDQDAIAGVTKTGKLALSFDLTAAERPKRPFHWPLEFPEVTISKGFDSFIGNPPFLGGKRISIELGAAYEKYLKHGFSAKGAADISCYFFRRSFDLLAKSGTLGLLSTNSITEGDSPAIGLQPIVENGGVIFAARSSFPWPGKAGVFVSQTHIYNGSYVGTKMLDAKLVQNISCKLNDEVDEKIFKLKGKLCRCTAGKQLYGKGFILEKNVANEFIREDAANSIVVMPYFNADIFNASYDWISPLSAIDFGEMEEADAKKYSAPFQHLVNTVKPVREKITKQVHEERFWLFWDKRSAFFSEAKRIGKVLVCGRHTAHLSFQFMDPTWVLSEALQLFCTGKFSDFGLLQSSIHEVWARKYSSTIGEGLRYSSSDAFDTFPVPREITAVGPIAERYYKTRQDVLYIRKEGLTDIYNRFHDEHENSNDIVELREQHRELDIAVSAAYGWSELSLDHGFHITKQGVRYTVSEFASREVLKRLLELNHLSYQLEVDEGLHAGNARNPISRLPKRRLASADFAQSSLSFDVESPTRQQSASPADTVLFFLKTCSGWQAKADILAATCITDRQWSFAIAELMTNGRVERQGEKRGVRYRIAGS